MDDFNLFLGLGIIIGTAGFYYLKKKTNFCKNFVEDQLTLQLIEKLLEASKNQKLLMIVLHSNDNDSKALLQNGYMNELRKNNSICVIDIPFQKVDGSKASGSFVLVESLVWSQKQSLGRVCLPELKEGAGSGDRRGTGTYRQQYSYQQQQFSYQQLQPQRLKRELLPVETYELEKSEPVFPQVFIVNGCKVNVNALHKLKDLYQEGRLFAEKKKATAFLDLSLTQHNKVATSTHQKQFNGEKMVRSQFQPQALKWIDQVLMEHALVVQLLNENLFQDTNSTFLHKELAKLLNFVGKFLHSPNAHAKWIFPVFHRNSL